MAKLPKDIWNEIMKYLSKSETVFLLSRPKYYLNYKYLGSDNLGVIRSREKIMEFLHHNIIEAIIETILNGCVGAITLFAEFLPEMYLLDI